jgi:hypothetical protein
VEVAKCLVGMSSLLVALALHQPSIPGLALKQKSLNSSDLYRSEASCFITGTAESLLPSITAGVPFGGVWGPHMLPVIQLWQQSLKDQHISCWPGSQCRKAIDPTRQGDKDGEREFFLLPVTS